MTSQSWGLRARTASAAGRAGSGSRGALRGGQRPATDRGRWPWQGAITIRGGVQRGIRVVAPPARRLVERAVDIVHELAHLWRAVIMPLNETRLWLGLKQGMVVACPAFDVSSFGKASAGRATLHRGPSRDCPSSRLPNHALGAEVVKFIKSGQFPFILMCSNYPFDQAVRFAGVAEHAVRYDGR